MVASSNCTLSDPDGDTLAELQRLYDEGRLLDAFERARTLPPLTEWRSTPARVLAGRLASRWGDTALSNRLHIRAHRADPASEDALYYYLYAVQARHGPFEALRILHERHRAVEPAARGATAWHLELQRAHLLNAFRDFTAAGRIIAEAEAFLADDPWFWVEKSYHLETRDDYAGALAAVEEGLRVRPWYRPAVTWRAHLLQLLQRDDEAIAFLREGTERVQSGEVAQALVAILLEKGRHADAAVALDLAIAGTPMADEAHRRWADARRAEIRYHLGDTAGAIECAKRIPTAYYKRFIERLEAPPAGARRVHLDVGFVRQHHMTCAPATLAALSNFWGRPGDHLAIAREICYDGTPNHVERTWAEKNGWWVREFRVTWATARALIDRGCPFGLVTTGVRNAHMQAVVGYDPILGLLLIRDPYQRIYTEWSEESFFEAQASTGPRGLLMIPPEEAARLADVELPEAGLYDEWHAVRCALARHDRSAAAAAFERLRGLDPVASLTRQADRELAIYDGRIAAALEATRALLGLFPKDANLQLDELNFLEQLGRTAEHRARLAERATARGALTIFRRHEAEAIRGDAREHARALKLMRAVMRRQPVDAANLRALANVLWGMRRWEEATPIYRLAACTGDKTEFHWDSYFAAARHVKRADACLELLRERVERLGDRSSQPVRTLFGALDAIDRGPEGFAVLAEARARHPEDGELLLFSAEAHGRYGRHELAGELLAAAGNVSSRMAWLVSAGRLAGYRADHAGALAHARALLEFNPLNLEAHRTIARRLAIIEGEAGARAHLARACAEHPHHVPLRQLRAEWLRGASPEDALECLGELLALGPANAWALRERALVLRALGRHEDALASADEAARIEPLAPTSHGVRADVLASLGRADEARAGYRAGIALSVDADWLFAPLLATCPDFAAKRAEIVFIQRELTRQPTLNEPYLRFHDVARTILPPEELEAALEELRQANRQDWSTWSATITHLMRQSRLDDALARGREAVGLFPLVPRLWVDLAAVHAQRGDLAEETAAYESALAISPNWVNARRQLSATHERALRFDDAEHALRRALASEPTDGVSHGWLADHLWRRGRRAEALAAMEQALTLWPGYAWGWDRLGEWSEPAGEPERAVRLAETFTRTRKGEAESWMRLVKMRAGAVHLDENLAALAEAERLEPRNQDVHELRAFVLAQAGRHGEALAACAPAVFGANPPRELRGRAAWIERNRSRRGEAIKLMKAVLADHPDYAWGWNLLTEWHWEAEEFREAAEAAAKWAWLSPDTPVPYGYIAGYEHRNRNRAAVIAALKRALTVDPTYSYGAHLWLDVGVDAADEAVAEEAARHIEAHLPAENALRARLRVHLLRGDRAAAADVLGRLVRLAEARAAGLTEAVDAMIAKEARKPAAVVLAAALRDETAHACTGALWLRTEAGRSPLATAFALGRAGIVRKHHDEAFAALIDKLGDDKRRWMLRALRWWKGASLRRSTRTWGAFGYAFNNVDLWRETVWWLRDWRARADAKPWMLFNLTNALQSLGRDTEAEAVVERALALPGDHTRARFQNWRAFALVLAGRVDEGRGLLANLTAEQFDTHGQAVHGFSVKLLAMEDTPPPERSAKRRELEAALRADLERLPLIAQAAALSRAYRRTRRRLAELADAGWWARARTYLPVDRLGRRAAPRAGSAAPSAADFPWWLIGIIALGLLRACAGLGQS